jgi:hypothetical protein
MTPLGGEKRFASAVAKRCVPRILLDDRGLVNTLWAETITDLWREMMCSDLCVSSLRIFWIRLLSLGALTRGDRRAATVMDFSALNYDSKSGNKVRIYRYIYIFFRSSSYLRNVKNRVLLAWLHTVEVSLPLTDVLFLA